MSTSSAITERHARRAYRLKCTGKGQVQVLDIIFFERVVNVWNSLPNEVDFSRLQSKVLHALLNAFLLMILLAVSYFQRNMFYALFALCQLA